MEYLRLPLYVLFGILPSLVWLFYYLRKDLHPEPKKMILDVFLYGVLVTIPVFFVQTQLSEILKQLQWFDFFHSFPVVVNNILKWFVVIAFTEEIFKYLVVKLVVFKNRELDEPLDVILYMIVAALGFAALENVLYLFSPIDSLSFQDLFSTTITISFIRFIGATLLHTLSSGLLGYFLALSFFNIQRRAALTVVGLSLAVILHGFYNFSIITLKSPINFIIPVIIILGSALFLFYAFNRIKKLKGLCKVESPFKINPIIKK